MSGDLEIFCNLSFTESKMNVFFFFPLFETTNCFTPTYPRNKKKKKLNLLCHHMSKSFTLIVSLLLGRLCHPMNTFFLFVCVFRKFTFERLQLSHERFQDSWPPEERDSIQGQ